MLYSKLWGFSIMCFITVIDKVHCTIKSTSYPILCSLLYIKPDFALTIHWQHYNEMFAFHDYLYKSQLQSQSFCVYNLHA